MRNAKFWIAGLALLLGTRVSAHPNEFYSGANRVVAQSAPLVAPPPPMGTLPDPTAPVASIAAWLSQAQQSLQQGTAWTNWAQDSIIALAGAIGAGTSGPVGPPGAAATVAVGSVSSAPAGTAASVTNAGTPNAAVLNFVIPVGANGVDGAPGANGVSLAPQTLPSPYTYQFHMNTGGVTSNETLSTNGGVLFISGPAVGAKSFADYLIPVFQAGNYKVKFRMWVSTGSTPVKFHLECPVGTTVATFSYVPPSSSPNYVQTGDNNDVGTKLPFALPQGLQDMRLVIDSAGVGPSINWFDWMALTKQ